MVKAHEKHEVIDSLFAGIWQQIPHPTSGSGSLIQQYEGSAARSCSAECSGLVEKRTR